MFQSFQNCPKFEPWSPTMSYRAFFLETTRIYLSSVIRNFNCNRYFRTVEWRIQGRGLWGRDLPPTPPPEKVKEKHFRENLTPTEQIPIFPRVSDIQIYLESFLHWLQILAVYEHIYYKTFFHIISFCLSTFFHLLFP